MTEPRYIKGLDEPEPVLVPASAQEGNLPPDTDDGWEGIRLEILDCVLDP